MDRKELLICSIVLAVTGGCFLITAIFIAFETKGHILRSAGVHEFAGRNVEMYGIRDVENIVISIPKDNPRREIVISDIRAGQPFVRVSVEDGRIRSVSAVNSSTDFLMVEAKSENNLFSMLKRVTPKNLGILRGQIDDDMDGTIDREVEIPESN